MNQARALQPGFAVMAAIFLLVILAALGAFMLTFSNTQQLTSAQDVMGTRAYWAARSGLEWGLASSSASCMTTPTTLSINAAGTFTVVVTGTSTAYIEGATTPTICRLDATATLPGVATGAVGAIERSLSVLLEK